MDPETAIEKYRELLWESKEDHGNPLNIVRNTLLASLASNPDNDDLLIELGIFHEVVTEEYEIALSYFDRVKDTDDFNYVFYKARCLATKRRKVEALKLIDGPSHVCDEDMKKLRFEIEDNEWGEYGELGLIPGET